MKKSRKIYPVILAGGAGERFWPLSRKDHPKQFLKIFSDKSMINETINRLLPIAPKNHIYIVCGENLYRPLRKMVGKQVSIINEPYGKNTAPAIALAAAKLVKKDPDGIMAVLSADHLIKPTAKFISCLKCAAVIAQDNHSLVTFGIKPARPDTGYGYIEIGKKLKTGRNQKAYQVKSFKEKPNQQTATTYIKSGKFLWNSGMFVWSLKTIMNEFKSSMPQLYKHLKIYQKNQTQKALLHFYKNVKKESIDYGVMEKARRVAVIECSFNWDDVGSWEALPRFSKLDKQGNLITGKSISLDCKNITLINKDQNNLIAVKGLQSLAIIQTPDALLIINKNEIKNIKTLTAQIKKQYPSLM